jgi:DNA-3-methyladenine glycosylase II
MTDEQIIETLTPIKGIGRWTVEMLLIFGLNRTDVWPIDDMGLQEGVRREWGWPTRPKAKEIIDFGDKFRPYRSIATWYLWRSKDVPLTQEELTTKNTKNTKNKKRESTRRSS